MKLNLQNEELILATIQNLDEGILIFDENKNLYFLNKKAEDLLKVKRSEVLGKNVAEFKTFSFFKPIFELLGLGLSNVIGQRLETNGKVLEMTSIDIVVGGEKKGDLIILRDITRESLIEKTKSEFVSLIAHQLRTPISSMIWMLKELMEERKGGLNKKQKEYLRDLYSNCERIVQFLNDLLNAIRIEEGRFLRKKELFSLEAIVELVIKLFQSEIEERKINLKYERPAKRLPLVKIDVEGIKTVVENLLDNALRYTQEGGEIEISLTTPVTETEIQFSIRDNGIGIPEDQKERIFTRFFRASNAIKKETEGSGLGLYISKNIIEAHGGKIWFKSKEGEGTTFYFSLPIEKE
jgi:signal transduction histidine kinase